MYLENVNVEFFPQHDVHLFCCHCITFSMLQQTGFVSKILPQERAEDSVNHTTFVRCQTTDPVLRVTTSYRINNYIVLLSSHKRLPNKFNVALELNNSLIFVTISAPGQYCKYKQDISRLLLHPLSFLVALFVQHYRHGPANGIG